MSIAQDTNHLSFEEKYSVQCVRLVGGLLHGLVAALPKGAVGEVYHHQIADGRVFEYELHGDWAKFLREIGKQ